MVLTRYQSIYPWMIVTAAAAVRLFHLTTTRLWYDESFTLLASRGSLTDAITATLYDVHPPLYYILTWSLLRITSLAPSVVLRGFSVLLSIIGLIVYWRLTGEIGMQRAARLWSLAFLAFSPVAIFYAQEARMYSLLVLLVVTQILALVRGRWMLLAASTGLLLYTHNYGLIYSAALGLLALYWRKPQAVIALAAGGAAWIPWAWALAGQMSSVATAYWIQPVTPGSVIMAMSRGWIGIHNPEAGSLASVLVVLPLVVLLTRYAIRSNRVWLLWLGLAPLVLAICISLVWRPMLLYRGLIGSLPALAMLAGGAYSTATGAGRVGRWLLLAPFLLAFCYQAAASQVAGVDHTGSPWPVPPSPVIYHLDDTSLIVYSANWPATRSVMIEAGCPFKASELTDQTRAALGVEYIAIDQLVDGYTVAVVVGPLSTDCHEAAYHRLTDSAQAVWTLETDYGVYGVWTHGQAR